MTPEYVDASDIIQPDTRSDAQKWLDAEMDKRWANEQGAEPYPILEAIALEVIEENHRLRAQIGQGVTDGSALQMEASVIQAQKVLSDWNEWYGLNGGNAPLPPSGIVKAQEMLAEVRSLLASAPPAPHQKPLTDEQIVDVARACYIDVTQNNQDSVCAFARAIESAHNIGEKK